MNSPTRVLIGARHLAPWSLIAVLSFFASGCIAWHSGTARDIDPWPPEHFQGKKPTPIRIQVNNYRIPALHLTHENRKEMMDRIRTRGEEVFNESQYFFAVPGASAEYELHLDVFNSGSPNLVLAIFSGITLTVIPAYASDIYHIDATLKHRSGAVLGTYKIKQKSAMLIQLVLILGMPFAFPSVVVDRMWHQIYSDLAVWSHEHIEKHKASGSAPPAPPPADPPPPPPSPPPTPPTPPPVS